MRKVNNPINNKIKASNIKELIQDDIIKDYTKIKEARKLKRNSMHLTFKAKEISIQNTNNNIYPIKPVSNLNNTQNWYKIWAYC